MGTRLSVDARPICVSKKSRLFAFLCFEEISFVCLIRYSKKPYYLWILQPLLSGGGQVGVKPRQRVLYQLWADGPAEELDGPHGPAAAPPFMAGLHTGTLFIHSR